MRDPAAMAAGFFAWVSVQLMGGREMLTSSECQRQAKEKTVEAERESGNQLRLLIAAQAWLILAGQLSRLESNTAGDCKGRSRR
jgi:hypothetical protein